MKKLLNNKKNKGGIIYENQKNLCLHQQRRQKIMNLLTLLFILSTVIVENFNLLDTYIPLDYQPLVRLIGLILISFYNYKKNQRQWQTKK